MKALHSVRPSRAYFQAIIMSFVLVLFTEPAMSAENQELSILTLGDSLTAGLSRTRGGTITCAPLGNLVLAADEQTLCVGGGREGVGGYQPTLKSLVGGKIYNFGRTNEKSADIKNRVNSVLSRGNFKIALVLAGTNDVIRNVDISSTVTSIQSIVDRLQDVDIKVIVGTIPPLEGGVFDNKERRVNELNDAIKSLEGVVVADLYAALITDWDNYTSGDNIHLGRTGNAVVASVWGEAIVEATQEPVNNSFLMPMLQLLLED